MKKLLILVLLLSVGMAFAGSMNIPGHSGTKRYVAAIWIPAAPEGLTFASVTTDTANISWSASTGATGYQIDIAEDAAFSTTRSIVTSASTVSPSYTLTGQPAGVALWARVRAVGAGGTSASSGVASGVLVTRTLDCSVPMQLTLGNQAANYAANADGVDALWTDASGHGNNATQSTHVNKPTASGSAVAFDGSNDRLAVPAMSLSGASAMTLVVKAGVKSLRQAMLLESFTGAAPYHQHYFPDTTNLEIYTSAGRVTRAHSISAGDVVTLAFLSNGAGSGIWKNGTQLGGAGDTSTLPTPLGYMIGYRATYEYQGDIYRLDLASGALSVAELASTALWLDAPPRGPTLEPITLVSSDTIIATWTHLAGVQSYRFDVSATSTFATFVTGWESRIVATSSASGLSITGLASATQYYVRARSVGAGGIGPSSTAVSGWTLTDLGAPGDGRVLEFLPETYTLNADGVDAVWTNTGTLGSAGNATQSTHANKPTASGAALAFDGSDDELDISGATLTGATAVTVVCRANLKTLGKNMFLESLTGGSPYHQHYMDAANDLNIYTTGALTRTPSISAGTQFTVAFVTNGAASSIWQDGTRVGEEGSAGALTIPSGYRIGYRSTYEFDGDLYGLRVYSRALTAAELASTSLWQWTH